MSADLAAEAVEIPDPTGWEQPVEVRIERTPTEDGAGEVVSVYIGPARGPGIYVSTDQAERMIAELQKMVAQARVID